MQEASNPPQNMFTIDALLSPTRQTDCETNFQHFLPRWQIPPNLSLYNSDRVADFQPFGGKSKVYNNEIVSHAVSVFVHLDLIFWDVLWACTLLLQDENHLNSGQDR